MTGPFVEVMMEMPGTIRGRLLLARALLFIINHESRVDVALGRPAVYASAKRSAVKKLFHARDRRQAMSAGQRGRIGGLP